MEFLNALHTVTPLGVIALLSYVLYLLVSKNGPVKSIANTTNNTMTDSLRRIEECLQEIRDGIMYLKTVDEHDRRRRV